MGAGIAIEMMIEIGLLNCSYIPGIRANQLQNRNP